MTTSNDDNVQKFLDQLQRRDEERRGVQKKMVGIDITETLAVENPGHLVPGWLVMKSSADAHQHRSDADYLQGMALETARQLLNSDTVPTGGERAFAADPARSLGRSNCGCLYLRTPETVEKAASEAYVNGITKAAPKRTWTPEEAAYLTSEANKLLGRDS